MDSSILKTIWKGDLEGEELETFEKIKKSGTLFILALLSNWVNKQWVLPASGKVSVEGFGRHIFSGLYWASFTWLDWVSLALYLVAFVIISAEIYKEAWESLTEGKLFNENLLMSLAATSALVLTNFGEAVAVMLFYSIGELFEDLAVEESQRSFRQLEQLRADSVWVKESQEEGAGLTSVDPSSLKIGDLYYARPGDRIGLDGTIVEGTSTLDLSALTGESLPQTVGVNDEILSASVNLTGPLTIQVNKTYSESTISKILDLVAHAAERKSPSERFVTRFAQVYTPCVVFSALALVAFLPLMGALLPGLSYGQRLMVWLRRAMNFLVISCPCALTLSVPLSIFAGLGRASQMGILIKGGVFLEELADLQTVLYDKTGTLTKAQFKVTEISAFVPAESGKGKTWTQEEVLEYLAHAEANSQHPLALAIQEEYASRGGQVDWGQVEDFVDVAGLGIRAKVKGQQVLAGNLRFLEKEWSEDGLAESKIKAGITADMEAHWSTGAPVFLGVDGALVGCLLLEDEVKEEARESLLALQDLQVKTQVVLSGDRQVVVDRLAQDLPLTAAYGDLLPADKVAVLEQYLKQDAQTGKLAFVGDGLNDAPVLARADLGIAMGGLGTDAALQAADVVLLKDSLDQLVSVVRIGKQTMQKVKQNIGMSLGIKIAVLVLAVLGFSNLWMAVFADVGVTILATLNALTIFRYHGHGHAHVEQVPALD